MRFTEKIFQAKLLSCLSYKVCRLLSSPVLVRKFIVDLRARHPNLDLGVEFR